MEHRTGLSRHFTPGQVALVAISAAFLAFYTAGLLLQPSEDYLRVQSNLIYNLPALVALVLVARRVRSSSKLERSGWLAMATMLVTWLAGDLIYSYYDLLLSSETPFPGLADIFYTAGYASLLVALPLLAYPRRLVGNLRWLLDVLLIMTVVGVFEWELIIQPILDEGGASFGESVLALSYPLWDLGLVAVVVGGILASHGNLSARSNVLLAAFATLAITDSMYSYGLVESGYENVGNPLEAGWLLAYILIGFAATMSGRPEPLRFERRLPLAWLVFPYLLALPLPIVQGVRAATGESIDVLSLGAAAVLLMSFLSHVHGSFLTTRAIEDERRKARLDNLTGSLNHGGIAEEAEELIAANPSTPLWLCMVDVDRLKYLNDNFGHHTGDLALKTIAGRLRRSGGIVGRYGGDEFLVIFEPHSYLDGETPEMLLRKALNGVFVEAEGGEELVVGASFGLAAYPQDAKDLAGLVEVADAAMYAQKRQKGTNRPVKVPLRPAGPEIAPKAV